jgi:hypothetical protein
LLLPQQDRWLVALEPERLVPRHVFLTGVDEPADLPDVVGPVLPPARRPEGEHLHRRVILDTPIVIPLRIVTVSVMVLTPHASGGHT